MSVTSFRELTVWQKSLQLTKSVYEITNKLPATEQFGLTSQLRRCAVSIPSNIAEGQQRRNRKEYRQFLGIAKGSAAELETQLILVKDIYKINVESLLNQLDEIQRMITVLSSRLSA